MLPLRILMPSLGISCHVGQAMGVLLSHLSSPVHLRKLTLEKDDLSDKAFCLLVSRG
jgi:hypothetical protein